MRIVEIFDSIQGEGRYTGYPTTFVRLAGCNLRCPWCDTKYAYDVDKFPDISPQKIAEKVKKYKQHNVAITGGEPLLKENIEELKDLVRRLYPYTISIFTNGTMDVSNLGEVRDQVSLVVDYKLKSAKPIVPFLKTNLIGLRFIDDLKFVVASMADFYEAERAIKRMYGHTMATFTMTPAYNKGFDIVLAEKIVQH